METVHGTKIALQVFDSDDSQEKIYYLPPSYERKIESSGMEVEEMDCSGLYLTFHGFNGAEPKKCPILKFEVQQ